MENEENGDEKRAKVLSAKHLAIATDMHKLITQATKSLKRDQAAAKVAAAYRADQLTTENAIKIYYRVKKEDYFGDADQHGNAKLSMEQEQGLVAAAEMFSYSNLPLEPTQVTEVVCDVYKVKVSNEWSMRWLERHKKRGTQ